MGSNQSTPGTKDENKTDGAGTNDNQDGLADAKYLDFTLDQLKDMAVEYHLDPRGDDPDALLKAIIQKMAENVRLGIALSNTRPVNNNSGIVDETMELDNVAGSGTGNAARDDRNTMEIDNTNNNDTVENAVNSVSKSSSRAERSGSTKGKRKLPEPSPNEGEDVPNDNCKKHRGEHLCPDCARKCK